MVELQGRVPRLCCKLSLGSLVCLILFTEIGIFHQAAGANPEFTISATDNVRFNSGGTGMSTINVTNLTPSAGTTYSVNLTYTVSLRAGLRVNLNPGAVICKPAGCGPSWGGAWSVGPSTAGFGSSTPGSYIVNITGTSDFSAHSVIVHVFVTDFGMSANPAALTVQAGRSGFSTITISGIAGFNGKVALSASVSPFGPKVSLDTASVIGSDDTALTVKIDSGVGLGNYTVMVQGTSGGLSHFANLTLTVVAFKPSSLAEIFGPDPTLFYSMMGILAVAVVAGLALLIRARIRTNK